MKISLKSIAPIVAFGVMSLSSCTSTADRTKDYLTSTNRNHDEFNKLTSDIEMENYYYQTTLQSRLDSMAYRDVFNSTKAAQDSEKVANFNKIAANYRAVLDDKYNFKKAIKSIKSKLVSGGITVKDLKKINSNTDNYGHPLHLTQHYADDWAYRKYFKKIGIYKGNIPKKCDEISKSIRPF